MLDAFSISNIFANEATRKSVTAIAFTVLIVCLILYKNRNPLIWFLPAIILPGWIMLCFIPKRADRKTRKAMWGYVKNIYSGFYAALKPEQLTAYEKYFLVMRVVFQEQSFLEGVRNNQADTIRQLADICLRAKSDGLNPEYLMIMYLQFTAQSLKNSEEAGKWPQKAIFWAYDRAGRINPYQAACTSDTTSFKSFNEIASDFLSIIQNKENLVRLTEGEEPTNPLIVLDWLKESFKGRPKLEALVQITESSTAQNRLSPEKSFDERSQGFI